MRIGIVGIGNMGAALTRGLLASGHEVSVFNRTRAKAAPLATDGVRVLETAADVINSTERTIIVLADAASAREVLLADDARAALRGKALLCAVAMHVDQMTQLVVDVSIQGGRLSESTIMSYPEAVERCQAEFILAAWEEDLEDWRRLLLDLGPSVYDVGAVGNASQAQLAFLMANLFVRVGIAYSLAAFEKLHLPVQLLRTMLSQNPACALPQAAATIDGMQRRDYLGTDWNIDMTIQSIDQAISLARSLEMDTDVVVNVRELYAQASRRGLGSCEANALYEILNPDTRTRSR